MTKLKPYNAYLFDLDGTLIDTCGLIITCYREAISNVEAQYKTTLRITDETIKANIGFPLLETLQLYFGHLPGVDIAEIKENYLNYQRAKWPGQIKAFPEAWECLQELKAQNKKIAIVTSRSREFTLLFCDALGLSPYIDGYLTPESTAMHKPHPEPALKAAQMLAENVIDCLFVGDSDYDIQCAAAAGMDSALVSWGIGAGASELVQKATYYIDSFGVIANRS